mgnify:CR=1 FL=1
MSILNSMFKAGDCEQLEAKILIYGDSGSGKTYGCSRSNNTIVLLCEKNGMVSVKNANPNALVVACTNISEVRAFMHEAMNGGLKKHGIQTIVIDGLTEIQRMIKDEILGSGKQMRLQDWGVLADKMRKLLRTIRNLPFNVICTALAEYTYDEDQVRYTNPQFEGKKTAAEVMQYFSAVGVAYKNVNKEQDTVEYKVLFGGPATVMCKSAGNLGKVEEGEAAQWLTKLAPTQEPVRRTNGVKRQRERA